MLKKALPVLLAPLLLAGCSTTITNLAPEHQVRNPNNLYPVEVALATRRHNISHYGDYSNASITQRNKNFFSNRVTGECNFFCIKKMCSFRV